MFSYPPDLPPALKLCMRQFNVITMGIYSDITVTFSMYISTSKLGANLGTAFSFENWFSFCVIFLSGTSGFPLPVCDVGGSPLKKGQLWSVSPTLTLSKSQCPSHFTFISFSPISMMTLISSWSPDSSLISISPPRDFNSFLWSLMENLSELDIDLMVGTTPEEVNTYHSHLLLSPL